MRLYCKLAVLVLIACVTQAAISTGAVGETYFALRCLAASTVGDAKLEATLVKECQVKLAAEQGREITVVALNAAPSW
jgi:hypothetical protein